jgi:hypothetical protein
VIAGGNLGEPGSYEARGKPADDGTLVLSGRGVSETKSNFGNAYPVFFQGRADGDRFVLKGGLGNRPCTLVIARQ